MADWLETKKEPEMTNDPFEALKFRGIDLINEMVESKFQETLNLDFKANLQKPADPLFSPDGKKLTKEGRKTIAKAASAFANSMGGVLIIGVDCRDIDGIDAAQSITPIPNLQRALSTVNNDLHAIAIPAITGIEAIAVPINGGSEGVIALSIPKSPRRPHRSNAVGVRSYFKRSGTSSVEMEHYEIEDAFLANSSPDVELEFELRGAGSGGRAPRENERPFYLSIEIFANNLGGGIAKHLFLECASADGGMRHFGTRHQKSHNHVGFVDGAAQSALPIDFILHAGTRRKIESFEIILYHDSQNDTIRVYDDLFERGDDKIFEFSFSLSAEGMRQRRQTAKFNLVEFAEAARIPIIQK